jgi:hypothetical protein
MLITLSAALMLLAQAAAPAPPAPAANTVSAVRVQAPEKPKAPKMVCETIAETGSYIVKQTCRTPEEVEALRLKAKENTDWVGDRTAFCKGRPGC